MYPFSLFAKAMNGEVMTPWERSQYKFWKLLLEAVGAFVVTNLPLIQQLLTDPGSVDPWYTVRAQLVVPLVMVIEEVVAKYFSAQTDTVPSPGQPLKIVTTSKRIKALHAGPSDVGNKPAAAIPAVVQNAPANPAPTEPVAAA